MDGRVKWGLPVGGPYAARVLLQRPFNLSLTSWLYTYNSRPDSFLWESQDGTAAWVARNQDATRIPELLNENGIEFVPMIARRSFHPHSGPTDSRGVCWLATGTSSHVACTVNQIVNTLVNVQRGLRTPMRWLMAQNEPWCTRTYMSPSEAVDVWRIYLQPVARLSNLSLVSPNVQFAHLSWFADFLRACYDRRNAADPCDVETVHGVAVHEYSCDESFWRSIYGGGGNGFRNAMSAALGSHGGFNWAAYFSSSSRRFWVTEHNCNWEGGGGFPSAVEQCLRVSGGRPETHGRGSIASMIDIDQVAAYAWWTTSGNYAVGGRQHNVRIANGDGSLTPPGRALVAVAQRDARTPPNISAVQALCSSPSPLPAAVASPPPAPWQPPVCTPTMQTACALGDAQRGQACSCQYVWQDGCDEPSSVTVSCGVQSSAEYEESR